MEFVYKNRKAHVRIELKEPPAWVSTAALGKTLSQHLLLPSPCLMASPTKALGLLGLKRP